MSLFPLVLGAMSIFSPFIGIILVMVYSAKSLGPAIVSPQRILTTFFVVPLLMLFFDRSVATQLMVLDAVFGVGFAVYVFLLALRRNQVLSEAFMISVIFITLYGVFRMLIFGDFIVQNYNEGIELVRNQMPSIFKAEYAEFSMNVWKSILPAIWSVSQISALLIGFILFHSVIGIHFNIAECRFPYQYNYLILALLPLYMFDFSKQMFINALIPLCMIPLIQGFCFVSRGVSKVISNKIVRSVIMIFILIYAFIPLVLFGYANGWMEISNNKRGGSTA